VNYFKGNLGAPFIITFIVLSLVSAVSFSLRMESLADSVMIYAYYSLVIGIILQTLSYIREKKQHGR